MSNDSSRSSSVSVVSSHGVDEHLTMLKKCEKKLRAAMKEAKHLSKGSTGKTSKRSRTNTITQAVGMQAIKALDDAKAAMQRSNVATANLNTVACKTNPSCTAAELDAAVAAEETGWTAFEAALALVDAKTEAIKQALDPEAREAGDKAPRTRSPTASALQKMDPHYMTGLLRRKYCQAATVTRSKNHIVIKTSGEFHKWCGGKHQYDGSKEKAVYSKIKKAAEGYEWYLIAKAVSQGTEYTFAQEKAALSAIAKAYAHYTCIENDTMHVVESMTVSLASTKSEEQIDIMSAILSDPTVMKANLALQAKAATPEYRHQGRSSAVSQQQHVAQQQPAQTPAGGQSGRPVELASLDPKDRIAGNGQVVPRDPVTPSNADKWKEKQTVLALCSDPAFDPRRTYAMGVPGQFYPVAQQAPEPNTQCSYCKHYGHSGTSASKPMNDCLKSLAKRGKDAKLDMMSVPKWVLDSPDARLLLRL